MVMPSPTSFVTIRLVKVKATVTMTKSRAALVITLPVFSNPRATASVLLRVRSHSSRMRLSRNTS